METINKAELEESFYGQFYDSFPDGDARYEAWPDFAEACRTGTKAAYEELFSSWGFNYPN